MATEYQNAHSFAQSAKHRKLNSFDQSRILLFADEIISCTSVLSLPCKRPIFTQLRVYDFIVQIINATPVTYVNIRKIKSNEISLQ